MEPLKERVVCAAVKLENGTIILGVRHLDKFMLQQIDRKTNPRITMDQQGFVTNKYRFISRKEAAQLEGNASGTLFSEDLY